MSDKSSTESWPTISPSAALRVDQVCNAFEAAWKTGPRPRIEDYLAAPRSQNSSHPAVNRERLRSMGSVILRRPA